MFLQERNEEPLTWQELDLLKKLLDASEDKLPPDQNWQRIYDKINYQLVEAMVKAI